MEAIEMIKERRSVRKFKDEVVDKKIMEEIMDATRWAPSWGNFQVARYSFVSNKDVIKRLATEGVNGFVYNKGTLTNASNVAVLSFVKGKSGKLDEDKYVTSKSNIWEVFDAALSCQNFVLAAHAKGIGTCIMGVINDKAISEIVNLPREETVAALIVYGYPAENPHKTPRKKVEEIVRFLN